jgi:hypothetical protein
MKQYSQEARRKVRTEEQYLVPDTLPPTFVCMNMVILKTARKQEEKA